MNNFIWDYKASGLGLREDDFSWQACYRFDPKFFLRRDKMKPSIITDALFGQVKDETASKLLAEFLILTGHVTQTRLRFTNITSADLSFMRAALTFDKLITIGKMSMSELGKECTNSFLDVEGHYFDAIIEIRNGH